MKGQPKPRTYSPHQLLTSQLLLQLLENWSQQAQGVTLGALKMTLEAWSVFNQIVVEGIALLVHLCEMMRASEALQRFQVTWYLHNLQEQSPEYIAYWEQKRTGHQKRKRVPLGIQRNGFHTLHRQPKEGGILAPQSWKAASMQEIAWLLAREFNLSVDEVGQSNCLF